MSWAQDGQETGRKWAQQSAEPGELCRLHRLYEALSPEEIESLSPLQVMSVVDPGSENDPQGAQEHWEQIVGFRTDSDVWEPEFVLGFIEGALEPDESEDTADQELSLEGTSSGEEDLDETDLRDDEYGKNYRAIDFDSPSTEEG